MIPPITFNGTIEAFSGDKSQVLVKRYSDSFQTWVPYVSVNVNKVGTVSYIEMPQWLAEKKGFI